MTNINKVLVTGGAGFVGSHVAEQYASQGAEVVVADNLSRAETLPTADRSDSAVLHNWRFLEGLENVSLHKADIRKADALTPLMEDVDAIVHTAAQVAVTSSVEDPRTDFEINALGTFNVLEAARNAPQDVAVVVASTNKVYGDNVNGIPVREEDTRYAYDDPAFEHGIPETLTVDGCEHTPYGTSKLTADLYAQDHAHMYGIRTGVFRMSCIYGTRQFGNEDQGWVAHFILSALRGKGLNIFGDGKQVRDLLWVKDLVNAYDAFLRSDLPHGVWNMGGGMGNTASLKELLGMLEDLTGNPTDLTYGDWRPGDQKVYISDIRKAEKELGWTPKVDPKEGVERFAAWAKSAGVV